ncbi:hypothetical protein BD408DRAFT_416770 [Parasitella parasitica]|nr:hypothetical protein BD408DRAFT_416770 [Parasitella parasitica]
MNNSFYCCLPLRAVVFIFGFVSLIWIVGWHLYININYIYYILGYEDRHVYAINSDFPQLKVIHGYSPFTISEYTAIVTYLMGIIASFMNSYKLAKVYKFLALFRAIKEPIDLVIHILRKGFVVTFFKYRMPELMEQQGITKEQTRLVYIATGIFLLLVHGSAIVRKIYVVYIAHKYQRYLLLLRNDSKKA